MKSFGRRSLWLLILVVLLLLLFFDRVCVFVFEESEGQFRRVEIERASLLVDPGLR